MVFSIHISHIIILKTWQRLCRWTNRVANRISNIESILSFKIVSLILVTIGSQVCAWQCSFKNLGSSALHLILKTFPPVGIAFIRRAICCNSHQVWFAVDELEPCKAAILWYTWEGWSLLSVAWAISCVCIAHMGSCSNILPRVITSHFFF